MKRLLFLLVGLLPGVFLQAQAWDDPDEFLGGGLRWVHYGYYNANALGGTLFYGRKFSDPLRVELQAGYSRELAGSRERIEEPLFRSAVLELLLNARILRENGLELSAGAGPVFRYFSYDRDRLRTTGTESAFALPGLGLQAAAAVRFHPDFEFGLLGFFQYFEKENEVSGGGVVLKWMIR